MTTDERQGLPSASGYERIHHCPASWRLSQAAGGRDDDTKDSESGTVTHALLSGEEPPREPTQAEKDRAQKCDEITQALLEQISPVEDGALWHISRELRLWLYAGLSPCFSGKLDFLASNSDYTEHLIIDYKTLYGDHACPADNWQIRAQAALVFEAFPQTEYIYAAIVQPESREKPDMATFIRDDLIRFRGQLAMDLNNIHDSNPHFKAGKWCQYCKALAICPVQKWQVGALSVGTLAEDKWALTSEPDRVRLYDACDQAEDFIKAVRKRIKEDVEAGNDYGGAFKLKPGRKTQTITDVSQAWTLLQGDIPLEDFNAACKVSKPELVDAVRKSKDITKKEAETLVENKLAAVIATTQAAPSLTRV